MKAIFKEKGEEKYYFDGSEWIKCNEAKLCALWTKWVVSKNTVREYDKDGFLLFGIKND